ncbi:F-box protein At1g61340-like isoform X1 [Prosopis cineraria]|uniref:F-box protein At1g61340-like isoform X1 n=2 Tax=Prosopis cineraria TaxID=364024 RepID=UPI00240FDB26|nr:F-box protein At1g61340-like isoform X1 [Prosopis cineraria]
MSSIPKRGLRLSRKRIAIPDNVEASPPDSSSMTPLKRMPNDTPSLNCEMSRLEALPHHILVKILCGVDHEDLEKLYHVSKTIKEAALIAKQSHFEFVTPKKNTFAIFSTPFEMEDEYFLAPLRKCESRLSGRNLAHITVALFASPAEEKWPRKQQSIDQKV